MSKILFPILLGFLILICFNSFSQISNLPNFDYENPKEYEIDEINITGVKYLDKNILVSMTGLKKGDIIKVPGYKITSMVKKLWKQGLFSDIEVRITKIVDGKISFDLYLIERSRLSKVNFIGIKKSRLEDIEEQVGLKRGQQITDNVLINTKNIIQEFYSEKGFHKAKISYVQQNDTIFANSVILNINVDKGERIKINEIVIDGNEILTDRQLRRAMKDTKQKAFLNFKTSKYIEEKYIDDKKKLITKYNEKGYRDATITSDTIFDFDENTMNLVMKINEGNQYFYRNINWVGNTKYTSEQLNKVLRIKKGDVYDQEMLNTRLSVDEDAIGNLFYLDNGYLFYNCMPVEVNIENDSIDLELRIYEGAQATVNKVTLSGNTRTKDRVALREIRTRPGQLFSRSDITRTIRELAQLGMFDPELLNVNPIPNQQDGTVDIEYIVEEKASDQVEISGGWGAGMVVGTVGLSFNNFSAMDAFKKGAWRPVPSGDGQQLSIRAQTNGKYYQYYNISFVEPWLGGKKPTSLTVSLYHSILSNSISVSGSNAYHKKITGISVGLGRRLKWPDDYFTLHNSISFQRYNLKNYQGYMPISDGISNSISLNTVFSRNSIDNPLYSRRGSSFSLGLQITPPFSLMNDIDYSDTENITEEEKYKWIEFHKWTFKADWYTQIVGDLVVHVATHFGFVGYFDKNRKTPFETYSLGGSGMQYRNYGTDLITMRGYDDDALTPEGGGYAYNKLALELRYPFSLKPSATIYAIAFLEGGNAWNQLQDYNPYDLKRTAGLGIRIFLPMLGMMGVDFGYGFDSLPNSTEPAGTNWQFILGQQF